MLIMQVNSITVGTVFAQTVTPLPSVSPTPTDQPAPSDSLIYPTQANPDRPTLDTSGAILPSANLRKSILVAKLSKASYQAKEKIELTVSNGTPSDQFNVLVENDGHREIKTHLDKKYVNGEFFFSVNPEVGMTPGRYTVKVINNATGQVILEQDFTWGVLAINTNKSIYAPGEKAKIAIGVLDDIGQMVCDARVKLEIESPNWQITTLSTDDGSIWVNNECAIHDVTEKPDYESVFTTGGTGRYYMTLTATTMRGTYTVKDRFEVRNYVPFDVERITATRIYPPETYPVTMKIKANQAFAGIIVESVPADFQISPGGEGTISYSEEKSLPQSYNPKTGTDIPDLRLPFNGSYRVTQGFGENIADPTERDIYKKSGLDGHDGTDFGMPDGTPIVSVDSGKVILAQEKWIYGTSIVIQHAWGRSYYGHLSKLEVKEGDDIASGQEIGLSGHTGLATGPHLHFGIKPKNSDMENLYFGKIDPAPFLGLASEDKTLSVADYPIAAKALVWYVNIEKGAEFTIGYHYKAPNKSPYFYSIGPLQFISSDIPVEQQAKFDVKKNPFVLGDSTVSSSSAKQNTTLTAPSAQVPTENQNVSKTKEEVVFSEIRQWQIAIDAPTRFYLPSTGTSPLTSLAADAGWEDTSILTRNKLITTKISSAFVSDSFDDNNAATRDILFRQYVSDPIAAQTISAQTLKFQIRSAIQLSGNSMLTSIGVRVVSNDGATVTGTILAVTRDGTVLTSTLTNRQFTATTTQVVASANDRIVVEIGTGGDPSGSNDHDTLLRVGDASASDLSEDDTSTTDNNPWVEFANPITFQAPPTVVLNTPTHGATGVSTAPTLNFTGTDAGGGENIEYNVQVDTVSTFDSTSAGFNLKYLDIYMGKNGTPTDNVTVGIRSSSITGSTIGTSDAVAGASISAGAPAYVRFTFATPVSLSASTKYYFVIQRSGARDTVNDYAVSYNTGSVYSGGGKYQEDNSSWGSESSTDDIRFIAYDTNTVAKVTQDTFNVTGSFEGGTGGSGEPGQAVGQSFTVSITGPLLSKFSQSDSGFTAGHPFTSGSAVDYTVDCSSPLATSTTYYWRVAGIDPTGSNTYGAWSTGGGSGYNSFTTSSTTTAPSPTNELLMRHGKYFSCGVEQPFTF